MIRLAIIAFLCATQTANALSCMIPDHLRIYTSARDSDDHFSFVIGQVTPLAPAYVPRNESGKHPFSATSEAPAQLVGRALASDGFTIPYDGEVTLRLSCFSNACGSVPYPGTEVFIALKHEGNARIVHLDACASKTLRSTEEAEQRIVDCHRFGKCDAAR